MEDCDPWAHVHAAAHAAADMDDASAEGAGQLSAAGASASATGDVAGTEILPAAPGVLALTLIDRHRCGQEEAEYVSSSAVPRQWRSFQVAAPLEAAQPRLELRGKEPPAKRHCRKRPAAAAAPVVAKRPAANTQAAQPESAAAFVRKLCAGSASLAEVHERLGLDEIGESSAEAGSDDDAARRRLLHAYLASSATVSMAAQARECETEHYEAQKFCKEYASALVHSDRLARMQVERAVCGSAGGIADNLIFYMDVVREDETPMKMGILNCIDKDVPKLPVVTASPGELLVPLSSFVVPGAHQVRKQKTVAKLLQSEASFAILYRHAATGALMSFTGTTLSWVQHVDRTTGECLAEARRLRDGVTSAAESFALRTMSSTLDQAKSNPRCQAEVARRRQAGWLQLPVACEVHMAQGCLRKAVKIVDEVVSGHIHFALAVNFSTGFNNFQKVLQEVIKERVVVKYGKPTPQAEQYKAHVLRLCCSRGARLSERRLALLAGPNGDWRNTQNVEVYVPIGSQNVDVAQLSRVVAANTAVMLAGSRFTVFDRHRWTRSDAAFSEWILLQACHGLGAAAFARWVSSYRVPKSTKAGAGGKGRKAGAKGAGRGGAPNADERSGCDDAVALGQAVALAAGRIAADTAEADCEQHRAKAAAFVNSSCLSTSIILRQIMEPFHVLLKEQLRVGSDEWDLEQQALEAKVLQQRLGFRPGQLGRDYPVLLAATGALEEKFQRQLGLLLHHPELWETILGPQAQTMRVRALAFRLLSSAGCSIEATLGAHHKKFPIRFFRAMLSKEEADRIAGTPECLQDEWSFKVIQKYKDGNDGLWGEVPQSIARLAARQIKMCISRIEALHAALRRRLVTRSTQTHALSLETLSAEHVIQRARRRLDKGEATSRVEARAAPALQDTAAVGPGVETGADDADAPVSRPGGGFRSFVRQGIPRNNGKFAPGSGDLWRAAPAEERSRHQRIGAAATLAAKHGAPRGRAFGPTNRQIQRGVENARGEAALARHTGSGGLHGTSQADRVALATKGALADPHAMSLSAKVKLANLQLQAFTKVDKAAKERDMAVLRDWTTDPDIKLVRDGALRAANIIPLRRHVSILPSMGSAVPLQLSVDPRTVGCLARALAIAAQAHHARAARMVAEDWQSKHRPIMHDECPKITEVTKPKRKIPLCSEVGLCLCSNDGKHLWAFRRGFFRCAAAKFRRKTAALTAMRDFYVVARLRGHVADADDGPWAIAAADARGAQLPEAQDIWWQIGLHSLQPRLSTYRRLRVATDQHVLLPGEIQLEALLLLLPPQPPRSQSVFVSSRFLHNVFIVLCSVQK